MYGPIVGTRHEACAPNQPSADIVHNVAIKIGHHHDIKLLGLGRQLHSGVTHNRGFGGDLRTVGYHIPTVGKRPSPSFVMLALCTAVTFLCPFSRASWKAYGQCAKAWPP